MLPLPKPELVSFRAFDSLLVILPQGGGAVSDAIYLTCPSPIKSYETVFPHQPLALEPVISSVTSIRTSYYDRNVVLIFIVSGFRMMYFLSIEEVRYSGT